MKIIIAGGTGLIGRLLTQKLIAEGHFVWVLSRRSGNPGTEGQTQMVKWDGRTTHGWQQLVEEADAIVNLAGENLGASRWTPKRKALLRSSRIEPALALVEAVRLAEHKPSVWLQASAVGYYGHHDEEEIDENSPSGSDELARLVVDWEDASQAVEGLGVRRIIMRQGIVLDDKEGALPRMLLPYRFFAGGPVGTGRQWISWISRNDIAEAMAFLLKNEQAHGVYNLTAPNPLTNADFGKTIAQVLHRPYWMPVPAIAMKAIFGEMATVVLDGQRVIPRRLLESGYQFRHPDLKSALQALFMR